MRATTLAVALQDPSLPVGTLIPVQAATVPAPLHREARATATTSWSEVYCPTSERKTWDWVTRSPILYPRGCTFGCKLYIRRQGATVRYAVIHSTTYGHSHSPGAR